MNAWFCCGNWECNGCVVAVGRSEVNAPLLPGECVPICVGCTRDDDWNGDGLPFSSSSVEFARNGDPVTDMLSFSKSFKLLSFSSVCVGVNWDEFVSDTFAGDRFGLVVLCGLLLLLLLLLLQMEFWLFIGMDGDAVPNVDKNSIF